MTPKRFLVDEMDDRLWERLAEEAKSGKLIAFPTETVYGIGFPASYGEADQKLRQVKGRKWDKPFSYHIANWDMLTSLDLKISEKARIFIEKFWPGPVTIIFKNSKEEKIGVRFPSDPDARKWIELMGEPMLATSANPSGSFSPCSADEVEDGLAGVLDAIIDAGETELEEDSTVLDLSSDDPRILRKGAQLEDFAEFLEELYGK